MKTNLGILALLVTTCSVQSTKMNHIETDKQLLMAQTGIKCKKTVHFKFRRNSKKQWHKIYPL